MPIKVIRISSCPSEVSKRKASELLLRATILPANSRLTRSSPGPVVSDIASIKAASETVRSTTDSSCGPRSIITASVIPSAERTVASINTISASIPLSASSLKLFIWPCKVISTLAASKPVSILTVLLTPLLMKSIWSAPLPLLILISPRLLVDCTSI